MAAGYTRVSPTQSERAEYMRNHPGARGPAVYRAVCDLCGTRLWLSGLGVGAHERGVKHHAAFISHHSPTQTP